ncbi:sll0787 family AIR synthase-like protein [Paenibacillus sp. sgz302251]|uniref:sll0787 family AIR synthase-like protein n=1 Tax=Paenibacillus sp. sgz302251 TaxID=3414493 RepID=UPI003C7B8771
MGELTALVEGLASSPGLLRKKNIQAPLRAFRWDRDKMLDPIGDDAAVLPVSDGYLLMSCDGILPELVREEPYWAGYCAVLVSISDIYAMGGRPTAIVNLLSAPDDDTAALIAEGMAEGSRKFEVPMVGGHFLPGEAAGVGTAIIGKANQLLRGTQGKPRQSLLVAIDLEGRPFKHYAQWDCTSQATPQALRAKLELLPLLAERKLASAARDISNAGILGTIAMLAENAGCGANVELNLIPKPESVEWERWLRMFPGYGFVLSADSESCMEIVSLFEAEGIVACVVGELTDDTRVVISKGVEEAVLIDWSKEALVVGKAEN